MTMTSSAETIFVVQQTGYGIVGASTSSEGSAQVPLPAPELPFHVTTTQLHRPDLRPIYGGPTLLEALWSEMDRLMEGLMTGADAEDGGDRYRAAELAWVLAIVGNPYAPSVGAIRAEAVARWNKQQEQI
jgi:hypothetical protein